MSVWQGRVSAQLLVGKCPHYKNGILFDNYVQVKDFMENQIILSFLNRVAPEVAASLMADQSR